jgi:16S rRNA (adenine1518-N6/adenine1519-N6)-dimethyltransferase
MDLLQETKRLLNFYKIFPKKRLGQSFMINSDLLKKMISYASINKKDVVLEVGAGLGFLTRALSERCKEVIAVEVDPHLTKILKEQISGLPNVDLIEGDILRVPVPQFNKVVSTPPYSISSPLLFWLLEKNFECATLTFQKEFAERLAASVGTKDYGRLTVTTYYLAEVDLLDSVPRSMFYPPPDVDSIVVRLKPRKPPFFVEDEEIFFELVQALFTQRNRKIRNAIVPFLHKREVENVNAVELADSLTFGEKRVRELAPEDFGALTNEVIQVMKGAN